MPRSCATTPGRSVFRAGASRPDDADPKAAALREAQEEIGLDPDFVSVIGYLPDHVVDDRLSRDAGGGLVRPGFELLLDSEEVEDTFEVPLDFIFDPANHRLRLRRSGFTGEEVQFCDIPYGERNIWGATAGMLLTLYRLCVEAPAAMSAAEDALSRLLALMARLRDPKQGCPWDLRQTFASIAPYTIEEAYEVVDAIEREDPRAPAR